MNIMEKDDLNGNDDNDNELNNAFIEDDSKQPVSDILSFSQDRSVSGISFLNTPNYTAFSINDPELSCLESWPQDSIEPFKVCPKRNASIRQESESYQEDESNQKYTKKRINQKMKIVNIKQSMSIQGSHHSSSSNYNSYCLRRKKKEVSYNEKSSDQESERNQLRFLVGEIKERPITRSFKKMETPKDQRD